MYTLYLESKISNVREYVIKTRDARFLVNLAKEVTVDYYTVEIRERNDTRYVSLADFVNEYEDNSNG